MFLRSLILCGSPPQLGHHPAPHCLPHRLLLRVARATPGRDHGTGLPLQSRYAPLQSYRASPSRLPGRIILSREPRGSNGQAGDMRTPDSNVRNMTPHRTSPMPQTFESIRWTLMNGMMTVPHRIPGGEPGQSARKSSSERPDCFRIFRKVPVGSVPGCMAA